MPARELNRRLSLRLFRFQKMVQAGNEKRNLVGRFPKMEGVFFFFSKSPKVVYPVDLSACHKNERQITGDGVRTVSSEVFFFRAFLVLVIYHPTRDAVFLPSTSRHRYLSAI